MKQIGYGVVHLIISLVLCTLAALGGSLFGGQAWMVFWVCVIAAVGFYREGVHDFGQHLDGFADRFRYSINPHNFDWSELKEDWWQAVTWPLGAVVVIWIFSTPFVW